MLILNTVEKRKKKHVKIKERKRKIMHIVVKIARKATSLMLIENLIKKIKRI